MFVTKAVGGGLGRLAGDISSRPAVLGDQRSVWTLHRKCLNMSVLLPLAAFANSVIMTQGTSLRSEDGTVDVVA